MNWPYYDFEPANGFVYDEDGNRVPFDGQARTAHEWEEYLEANDIRGSVR
jgi:hypothetical protein